MKKLFVKKNKVDESTAVENDNHDEGRKKEVDKNGKSVCKEENNKEDREKAGEEEGEGKNAARSRERRRREDSSSRGRIEKKEEEGIMVAIQGDEHKEEEKNDAPEKEGIVEEEKENPLANIDDFLKNVVDGINNMQVEDKNVEECLDNE
ncbi:hypothetical protein FXO38_06489 [Capsicum annuum]|nr:hypothetical protein FXO38_06489 [Capsicum annuum]